LADAIRRLQAEHLMTAQDFFLQRARAPFDPAVVTAELRVSGEVGGVWSVSCDPLQPAICPGSHGTCRCVVEMTSQAFDSLCQTPTRDKAVRLWESGAIAVSGEASHGLGALGSIFSPTGECGPASVVEPLFGMPAGTFQAHFPDELIVSHGAKARAPGLLDLPDLQGLDELLEIWHGDVGVHSPGASDDSRSSLVPVRAARELALKGCNLSFNNMERVIPGLERALRLLSAELGLPTTAIGKCIGFYSATGSGTVPHFDNNINISVQMEGEKVWEFAPNPCVTNPTFRYLIIDGKGEFQGRRPELQVTKPLPARMPLEGKDIITFRPGTVAYIPPGYWHGTCAVRQSFSFNFWFSGWNWAKAVVTAVTDRLLQLPHWRELAQGLGCGGAFGAQAEEHLATLLKRLNQDLQDVGIADVLSGMQLPPVTTLPPQEWYVALLRNGWIEAKADTGRRPTVARPDLPEGLVSSS
jgi:50S ribosomal protein L16 3-hydroxylase